MIVNCGGNKIYVDDTLSITSVNAIQNKAVSIAINGVIARIDGIDTTIGNIQHDIGEIQDDVADLETGTAKLNGDNVFTGNNQFDVNPKGANPVSGAVDTSIPNCNYISQSGDDAPNNLAHRNGAETYYDDKAFINRLQAFTLGFDTTTRITNTHADKWVKLCSTTCTPYHNFEFEIIGGRNNGSYSHCKFAIITNTTSSKLIVTYNLATSSAFKSVLKLSYDSATNKYTLWAKGLANHIQSLYYGGNLYYGSPQNGSYDFWWDTEDWDVDQEEPVTSGTVTVFNMEALV